jgi:cell division protein FtsX
MRVVMTTALSALLLSAAALLLYELRSHRQDWERDLRSQASFVARASLPLDDADDLRAARENLADVRRRAGE